MSQDFQDFPKTREIEFELSEQELELSDELNYEDEDEDEESELYPPELLAELAKSESRSQNLTGSGKSHQKEVLRPEISDSLMRDVLAGKSYQERLEIMKMTYQAGIEKDDPLFVVMLATGQLELLLHQKPQELKRFFAVCRRVIKKDIDTGKAFIEQAIDEAIRGLDSQAAAAVKLQQKSIASATSTLIKQAALEKISYDIYALIKGGLVTLTAVGLGIVIGLAIPFFRAKPQLDPTGPRQLTLGEAIALNWALSKEGQFARQFMGWNQTLLSGKDQRVCADEVSRLGVTLTLEGREAATGFCTLWVEPPDRRQFIE